MYDACNIAAKDCRPFLKKDSGVKHVPVQRVDGYSCISDNNFPWTGCGQRSVADFQGGAGLGKPGGLILWHGHGSMWRLKKKPNNSV